MTLLFSLLLLSSDNSEYVLLQKGNYECVKTCCDSMPVHISLKPLSKPKLMPYLKPKTSKAGN